MDAIPLHRKPGPVPHTPREGATNSTDAWDLFLEQNLHTEEDFYTLQFDYDYSEEYRDEDENAEIERRLNLRSEEIGELRESVMSLSTRKPGDLGLALRAIIDPVVAELRAELSPEVRWARAQKQKEQFEEELRIDRLGTMGRLWDAVRTGLFRPTTRKTSAIEEVERVSMSDLANEEVGSPRGGKGDTLRHGLGLFLVGSGTILKTIFVIILFASAATGIWWPLTLAIIDKPISVLWWVPLGMFFTGLSFGIAQFVYDLVIGMPLALLTTWLLREA